MTDRSHRDTQPLVETGFADAQPDISHREFSRTRGLCAVIAAGLFALFVAVIAIGLYAFL